MIDCIAVNQRTLSSIFFMISPVSFCIWSYAPAGYIVSARRNLSCYHGVLCGNLRPESGYVMVRGVSSLSSCCFLAVFCVFLRPELGYMMVQGVTALPSCCFLAVFCVFLRPESGYMMVRGVSALSSCCLLAIFLLSFAYFYARNRAMWWWKA